MSNTHIYAKCPVTIGKGALLCDRVSDDCDDDDVGYIRCFIRMKRVGQRTRFPLRTTGGNAAKHLAATVGRPAQVIGRLYVR